MSILRYRLLARRHQLAMKLHLHIKIIHHIPINFSAREENPMVTDSPVHLTYDCQFSNSDNFLAQL
jgi:hypothetical protein